MGVETLYMVLAQALLSACPSSATDMRIEAHLKNDWSKTTYICKIGGDWTKGLSIPAETDWKVDDALHSIRKSMTIPGEQPWSRCTFTLFPDGKFKFDVEYDD